MSDEQVYVIFQRLKSDNKIKEIYTS